MKPIKLNRVPTDVMARITAKIALDAFLIKHEANAIQQAQKRASDAKRAAGNAKRILGAARSVISEANALSDYYQKDISPTFPGKPDEISQAEIDGALALFAKISEWHDFHHELNTWTSRPRHWRLDELIGALNDELIRYCNETTTIGIIVEQLAAYGIIADRAQVKYRIRKKS